MGATLEVDVVVGTGAATVAEVVAAADVAAAASVDELVVVATGRASVVEVVVGTMADVVTVALGSANEIC